MKMEKKEKNFFKNWVEDFPVVQGLVQTPCFHCRGHRLDHWLGRDSPMLCGVGPPKKNNWVEGAIESR